MLDGTFGGAFSILAATAATAAGIALVLHARQLAAGGLRLGRRLRLLPPAAPPPVGMPLERIARDLRRLRPQLVHPAGQPVARYRGVVAAYDDALVDACRALGIATDLPGLPPGLDRETERLRVEVELERAGVQLHRA